MVLAINSGISFSGLRSLAKDLSSQASQVLCRLAQLVSQKGLNQIQSSAHQALHLVACERLCQKAHLSQRVVEVLTQQIMESPEKIARFKRSKEPGDFPSRTILYVPQLQKLLTCKNRTSLNDLLLGKGGFKKVTTAEELDPEDVQIFRVARAVSRDCLGLENEVKMIRDLRNQGVTGIIEILSMGRYISDDGVEKIEILTPLYSDTLQNAIDTHVLTLEEKDRIASQMIKTVVELHRYGVIHRDLKPTNWLLDDQKNPVLIDFGLSCKAAPTDERERMFMERFCGTRGFTSPEYNLASELDFLLNDPELQRILRRKTNTFTLDVYSLGITLLSLYFSDLCMRYADQSEAALLNALKETLDPRIPMILKMIDRSPAKRPSISDVQLYFERLRNQSSLGL